jgi:ABC-type nitrate/sulfonate/bicarbonate transport system substrate-binding protein
MLNERCFYAALGCLRSWSLQEIRIERQPATPDPQVSAQVVVSEEADFYTDGPDLINARLRGGQVKYFGGTMQQLVFQIWGAKEIKSIKDLKGKTVAASTPRAALDTATREALKKNGLVPDKDVQILYVRRFMLGGENFCRDFVCAQHA